MARPPRGSMYNQPRSNSLLAFLALLARALLAYALAFWLYVFLYRFTFALRDYGLGDTGRSIVFFVFLIVVILTLLIPVMQDGNSGGLRVTGVMTGFILLTLALSQAAGIFVFDPNAPLAEIFRKNFVPWAFRGNFFRN